MLRTDFCAKVSRQVSRFAFAGNSSGRGEVLLDDPRSVNH